MPCDEVRYVGVELGPNTDPDLLAEALESLGYNVTRSDGMLYFRHRETGELGDWREGSSSLDVEEGLQLDTDPNVLRRAYAEATIRKVSKRMGWKIERDQRAKRKGRTVLRATRRKVGR